MANGYDTGDRRSLKNLCEILKETRMEGDAEKYSTPKNLPIIFFITLLPSHLYHLSNPAI